MKSLLAIIFVLVLTAFEIALINHYSDKPARREAVSALALPTIQGKVLSHSEAQVCAKGYSASVRPPEAFTSALKRKQIASLGLPGGPGDYEEDHFISLALGGDPRSPQNLWPQPWNQARADDKKEFAWYKQVCWSHSLSLDKAQQEEKAWKLTNG